MLLQKVDIKYIYRTTIYTNIENHIEAKTLAAVHHFHLLKPAAHPPRVTPYFVTQHPLLLSNLMVF